MADARSPFEPALIEPLPDRDVRGGAWGCCASRRRSSFSITLREAPMVSDPDLPLYANRPLTPRQDRIEATIERVLRAGGTRSELRDAVYQYADHARLQQVPPERMVSMVKAVAMRA